MSRKDLTDDAPVGTRSAADRITPAQIERARRIVACNATGVQDCRMLLDMLGLLPDSLERD